MEITLCVCVFVYVRWSIEMPSEQMYTFTQVLTHTFLICKSHFTAKEIEKLFANER